MIMFLVAHSNCKLQLEIHSTCSCRNNQLHYSRHWFEPKNEPRIEQLIVKYNLVYCISRSIVIELEISKSLKLIFVMICSKNWYTIETYVCVVYPNIQLFGLSWFFQNIMIKCKNYTYSIIYKLYTYNNAFSNDLKFCIQSQYFWHSKII